MVQKSCGQFDSRLWRVPTFIWVPSSGSSNRVCNHRPPSDKTRDGDTFKVVLSTNETPAANKHQRGGIESRCPSPRRLSPSPAPITPALKRGNDRKNSLEVILTGRFLTCHLTKPQFLISHMIPVPEKHPSKFPASKTTYCPQAKSRKVEEGFR
jgi:hypothetical protein